MLNSEYISDSKNRESGLYAVLGMDIESFSTLHDDDQILAIEMLQRWIHQALNYLDITNGEYIWSPGGDGGYITFTSVPACRSAIDVAFAICEKANRPAWTPRDRPHVRIRFGIHAGQIHKGADLGGDSNVWGIGINVTSRILGISAPSQLLISKQYYDSFIRGQRDDDLEIGEPFCRTMKHDQQIEVLNVNRGSICLNEEQATALRWQSIGGLWRKTIQEYRHLIQDAMMSDDPVAALAAAKFSLDMGEYKTAHNLCHMLGNFDEKVVDGYPRRFHRLFSKMTPDTILKILGAAQPRFFRKGDKIGIAGEDSNSCFFPVSGIIETHILGRKYRFKKGDIVGEFGLWISDIKRVSDIVAGDDGLCLEINTEDFKKIIPESNALEDGVGREVYTLIKRRIIDNILRSERFFPNCSRNLRDDLICEKHRPGEDPLNLEQYSYILFKGRLGISPTVNEPGSKLNGSKSRSTTSKLNIAASGQPGHEQAVGIISRPGTPDGREAVILEESITVSISRQKLISLQEDFPSVQLAWDGLYGQRVGEIISYRGQQSSVRSKELTNLVDLVDT